ncbi:MAG TPA: DUF1571 domain-containing protein [Thermoguttaceae bacterium]|nr:DUF1571 domain-containing protein [Thermoguttaceae bacterium]
MVRAFSVLAVFFAAVSIGAAAEPAEHPLVPLIRFAEQRLQTLDNDIRDYTCTLVKRERIDGQLRDYEQLSVKLRHEQVRQDRVVTPFAVFLRFLAPAEVKGREVVYVRGRNKDKVIVWRGGPKLAYVTTAVSPDSDLALRFAHYPISEIGMKNLTERLIQMGKQELAHNECEVVYVDGAKINGRPCMMVQLTHSVRRPHFRYYMARVFIDDELKLPMCYASYDWPTAKGEAPPLIEEYTYLDVKLNVGLSDYDFDYHNPAYRFRKTFEP